MIINPKVAIENGWITRPKGISKKQIQQNGIDLTVGSIQIPTYYKNNLPVIKNKTLPDFKNLTRTYGYWAVNTDRPFYLINCKESINLPKNVCAMIFKRSTLNRMGCQLQSGLWDSGFKGTIGFTIWPSIAIVVNLNDRLAQIVFMEAESNVLYEGGYKNQKEH